jgi:hypothetical protein
MLKVATTFRGKCPKHPRYNPATDTPAELDQACRCCAALAAIHAAHQQLLGAIREFPERYRAYPAVRSTAVPSPTAPQLALFVLTPDQEGS